MDGYGGDYDCTAEYEPLAKRARIGLAPQTVRLPHGPALPNCVRLYAATDCVVACVVGGALLVRACWGLPGSPFALQCLSMGPCVVGW